MTTTNLYDIITILLLGTAETLCLALVSSCLGIILGITLFFSWFYSKNPLIKKLVMQFVSCLRSLPEILILFAIYFGGSMFLSNILNSDIEIPSFLAGILALSIIFAAYATKLFQSASILISKGELEASKHLGLTQFQTFYHIIWPQLWKNALPGLGNLWLILLKDTVLISLIGGQDLMSRTQIIVQNTQEPFKYYILISCVYLTLSYISEHCIRKAETNGK